jgi:hypothetical protein
LAPIRSAVAARCFTLRVLQDNTLPPLTRFSGHKPSHEAKAEAWRNRLTSVPISVRLTYAATAQCTNAPRNAHFYPHSNRIRGWICSTSRAGASPDTSVAV